MSGSTLDMPGTTGSLNMAEYEKVRYEGKVISMRDDDYGLGEGSNVTSPAGTATDLKTSVQAASAPVTATSSSSACSTARAPVVDADTEIVRRRLRAV